MHHAGAGAFNKSHERAEHPAERRAGVRVAGREPRAKPRELREARLEIRKVAKATTTTFGRAQAASTLARCCRLSAAGLGLRLHAGLCRRAPARRSSSERSVSRADWSCLQVTAEPLELEPQLGKPPRSWHARRVTTRAVGSPSFSNRPVVSRQAANIRSRPMLMRSPRAGRVRRSMPAGARRQGARRRRLDTQAQTRLRGFLFAAARPWSPPSRAAALASRDDGGSPNVPALRSGVSAPRSGWPSEWIRSASSQPTGRARSLSSSFGTEQRPAGAGRLWARSRGRPAWASALFDDDGGPGREGPLQALETHDGVIGRPPHLAGEKP